MKPEDSGQAPTVEDLAKEIDSLRKQNEKLVAENERLRKELEESLRRLKRQAAPFSRGKRKKKPKCPGRKSGAEYGKQVNRPIPDHVDEQVSVPLPKQCECGGAAIYDETQPQYQEESFARLSCGVSTSRLVIARAVAGAFKPASLADFRCRAILRTAEKASTYKTWGGNLTDNGAAAQKILMSVLGTCHQQGKDSFQRIVELLRSPVPVILDIARARASP